MKKVILLALTSLVFEASFLFAGPPTTAPSVVAQSVIDKSLAYLKTKQQADGTWQMSPQEPPGITALVLRSFVGDGSNFSYAKDDFLKRGYASLLATQQANGQIASDMLANYNTTIAVSALAAANDPALKPAMDKAVTYLEKTQWVEGYVGPKGEEAKDKSNTFYGGFGYGRHTRPDLSNTHFDMEALHDAGLKPGDKAFEAAKAFIERCQNRSESNDQPWAGNDGGFVYSGANGGDSEAGTYTSADGKKMWRSYGSMTYAGLKSMIYAGVSRDDPRVKAALGWIEKHWSMDENPGMSDADPKNAQHGLYYYFQVMSKALDAYDQPTITDAQGTAHDWRAELVNKIASLQHSDGSFAGEKRWMENNPVLTTAYCVLTLEQVQKDLKEHPEK